MNCESFENDMRMETLRKSMLLLVVKVLLTLLGALSKPRKTLPDFLEISTSMIPSLRLQGNILTGIKVVSLF